MSEYPLLVKRRETPRREDEPRGVSVWRAIGVAVAVFVVVFVPLALPVGRGIDHGRLLVSVPVLACAGCAAWALSHARGHRRSLSVRRACWHGACGGVLLVAAGLIVVSPRLSAMGIDPAIVVETAGTILGVYVAVEVAARYGIGLDALGVSPPDGLVGWAQDLQIAVLVFTLNWAGTLVQCAIAWDWSLHGAPIRRDIAGHVVLSLSAGIVEELIIVGLVCCLCEVARAPAVASYATSLAMRIAIHGVAVATIASVAVWGGASVWLYRRTRRLAPIIAGHIAYDLSLITLVTLGRS